MELAWHAKFVIFKFGDSTHSGMNQDEPMLPLQGDLMVIWWWLMDINGD